MATTPLSGSSSVYSTSAIDRAGLPRAISRTGLKCGNAAFFRVGPSRSLTLGLATYTSDLLAALSSYRGLTCALAAYDIGGSPRDGASRPISASYDLFKPLPEAPQDRLKPVVDNFIPAIGTPILKEASITFDVTDDSGSFRKVFIAAEFMQTGVVELVHDGDTFRGYYSAYSSRRIIPHGLRYTICRFGGWPANPTIQVYAMDLNGNES